MYSQANVRVESVLRPPTRALPSVIVDTDKVLREADGSVKLVVVRPAHGWKGVRPGVRLKSRTVRNPKNTSASETRSSARTCLTSVALKKYVVRWTNWRTKTTRTTSLQKKFVCTETIGGFVRTQLVPIRCQFGIELTSSKHCQPCDSSKIKRMQLISKDGKAIPHLGGTGNTTKTDPALIDQGNLLKSDWDTYSRYDSQN